MAKRGRKKADSGEQGQLIDTAPENEKEIIAAAKDYKKKMTKRQALLADEVAAKERVKDLMKAAGLQPVDGKIDRHFDGVTITLTPQDVKVRVKFDDEEEE